MNAVHQFAILACGLALAGCAGNEYEALPAGQAAYQIAPSIDQAKISPEYAIANGDELSLNVFAEPDLSVEKVIVDDAGRIQVPMVGSVVVGGLSPAQASKAIEERLAKYLRQPRASLNITVMADKLVSIEGQVTKAGTYPVTSTTTLLGAVAMAQSPTRIAKLDDTVLFRTVNGERMAARFDLKRIRAGIDPDPQILGGDVIVVGFSTSKSVYRDILTAAPIFNVFTRF